MSNQRHCGGKVCLGEVGIRWRLIASATCKCCAICYLSAAESSECYAACHARYALQHIVDNMIYLIQQYDHIPNGIRTYYLNRR